ncbi:CLUMA_CG020826, isoform A [Clunio marinus]|uniref:CLUMA_CG020826, isoform A n=1 Tax=Clunio marinus TaxID=568069 RepID=A0A1J1J9N1_9DIPT|nr:CLUMA_CG020826, isoform A [Clunio marinus]
MKLIFVLFLISVVNAKIIIQKWEIQSDPKFAELKYEVKDGKSMSIDVHCLNDADDIMIKAAAYSKVDGVFNPFVAPDPIHICKVHEHEDPLVKFMHEEILKFGNVTKACSLKKGTYLYMHDFVVDETKFPVPLPEGEFRVDVNATIIDGGAHTHAYYSELFFKTVKE